MYIGTSKVTSKGQLTIPKEIRRKRDLNGGKDVIIIDTEAGILIKNAKDLETIFYPFAEISKKEKLTKKKLAKEIEKEKMKTLELFK